MIVILRMNCRFMEFMRENYPQLVKDVVSKRQGRDLSMTETDADGCVILD